MILQRILTSNNIVIYAIVGAIAGLLLLIGLFFLIQKVFLAKRKCEKIISELERKYEYLHSLLLGQDAQYINRLELISRTNLLYGDIYSTYFRRFKEIRDNQDIGYQDVVNTLRDLHADNEVKEFKKYYSNNAGVVKNYEEAVENLNKDLIELIKPEEDARQNVLVLKEKFREVKSKYNMYENELTYLSDTFAKYFDAIDQKFTTYDSFVESANYDLAAEIIPTLDKVLDTLIATIIKMPGVLKELNETLPDRIKEVTEDYEALIKEGFPLKTFNIEELINNLNYDLDKTREKVKNLRISHIDEEIEAIHSGLAEIEASFQEEKESRKIFEESNEQISDLFVYLEREFIKISNKMPQYKKGYAIDENHEKLFEEIRQKVDEVGKDKRRLEIYVHSMGKTPYKVLVEKMTDLDNGTQDLKVKLNAFKAYLASLKTDSESTFKLIEGQYVKIKQYEALVRNTYSSKTCELLDPKFKQTYDLIDNIYGILMNVPIDVIKLNETTNKLTNLSASIFNYVDDLAHYQISTIKTILIGNRERQKFSDVNALLEQAENFYNDGDYKRAFELGSQALSTLKQKDGSNI